MNSLKIWSRKPLADKTYTNMKTCMRIEYNNIDEAGGLTITNSNLNQANILQELKSYQEQMVDRMEQDIKVNMIETLSYLCGQMENESVTPQ